MGNYGRNGKNQKIQTANILLKGVSPEMKKRPLLILSFALLLLAGLLLPGCKDKINPVSDHWRTWEKGDTVPGYVLSDPSGSRADVRAKAQMWDNYYALELACAMNTGHPDDNVFLPDTSLVFAVLISDHSRTVWNGAFYVLLVWSDTDYEDPYVVSVYDLAANGRSAPTIDGDGGDEAWSGGVPETKLDIMGLVGDNGLQEAYLVAVHDSTNIYFKLAWPDPTNTMSVQMDPWSFDGSVWSQEEVEDDMVLFYFPTDTPPTDWDTLGVGTIDPVDGTTTDGSCNVWGWSAGLTNPVGYADDLLATSTALEGDAGTAAYEMNDDPDKSYPPLVQDPAVEPSAGPEALLESEAIPFEETIRP
jgi:hypothetical protein